jgi:hypothetical protein
MSMNSGEIDEACEKWAWHPVLGPASATLASLRDWANSNSDGWAYAPKPANAAKQLMRLVEGDGTAQYRFGDREDATEARLRSAYSPIKAFRTRCLKAGMKADFQIFEAGQAVDEPGMANL